MPRTVAAGDFFYAGDLGVGPAPARDYAFRRPWGVPVRYHDVAQLTAGRAPDFVEFHFSARDLDIPPAEVFDRPLPHAFTTHLPDLFPGDFLVDLASPDEDVWRRSLHEVQRTIDRPRDLVPFFAVEEEPLVVATMGGFTRTGHIPAAERERGYERIGQALARLDTSGVRLTAQTLPPFPWLLGGQQFHNLFMDPEDTARFCEETRRRLTFDVSHTKLAATFAGRPFSEYVDIMGPHIEHLHIVDAVGIDGEGVQVGEGEVDFRDLAERLARLAPQAPFIPEIWQGHVNNGEGFFTALDRLEQWF